MSRSDTAEPEETQATPGYNYNTPFLPTRYRTIAARYCPRPCSPSVSSAVVRMRHPESIEESQTISRHGRIPCQRQVLFLLFQTKRRSDEVFFCTTGCRGRQLATTTNQGARPLFCQQETTEQSRCDVVSATTGLVCVENDDELINDASN